VRTGTVHAFRESRFSQLCESNQFFFDRGEHERNVFWGRLSKRDEKLKPNLIIKIK